MPSIEERRLVKLGTSVIVTLPHGWLRYHGLKAGDRVLVRVNGCLTIRPATATEKTPGTERSSRPTAGAVTATLAQPSP